MTLIKPLMQPIIIQAQMSSIWISRHLPIVLINSVPWLKKDRTRTANIEIPGYTIEHTSTEAYCGGTLLYIKDSLKYVCRNNLEIYKAGELESTFVELFSSSGKHIIIGCIYRHRSMNLSEFDSSYLNDLLEELSHKNKKIF